MDTETQEGVQSNVKCILDKLTSQAFLSLVPEIVALKVYINTEDKLQSVIGLVFEKAVTDQTICAACASMCRCLCTFRVEAEGHVGTVNVRELLDKKCLGELETIRRRQNGNPETTDVSKEDVKSASEDEKLNVVTKSSGIIRLIGELYKARMLPESTLLECLPILTGTEEPESLECLCTLLKTHGITMQSESARAKLDLCLDQMRRIVAEKKIPQASRLMLQNLIDLGMRGTDLHRAENPWKPRHKDSKAQSEEDMRTQELYKKAKSILNKLTPQKFKTLMSQMQALEIDSESKLKGIVSLIYEHVIKTPKYSVAYANMCRCLSMFKVQSDTKEGEMVNFRAVLLTRCQREFERDKSSEQLFTSKRKEIADEQSETKKEELKAELEFEISKAKRRSLENFRFIGELFKLKMLTETIMHDCVFKLLRTKDPENLECLCRLLTTIGKELDTDKARPRMDQYFQQIGKIVHEKKTPSRVRFKLQDVMDLRKNKWVPRRDDSNPKTIDQIHREVAKEAQEKALMSQQILVQQKTSKGFGGRPGGRKEPGSLGGPSRQGADDWNTFGTRTPLRSVHRTIDPAKMMKTPKPQQVGDFIQLGSWGEAGRFAGWGQRSTGVGAKTSQKSDRLSNPNRFSALGAKGDEESGRRGFSGASPAREGRGRGGFGRPTMLSARHSQESEREKIIAAAKSIDVRQSLESNRRERSRGSEPQKERPIEKPAPEVKLLSSDEIRKKTIAILDEYLHIQDLKEAVLCVKELPPGNHPDLVTNALNHVLYHVHAVARKQTGHLLHDVVKQGIVSIDSYLKGIKEVLEFAEDMEIDIPEIWQYLGELIGPMVQDGSVPLSFLKEACESLKEGNKAGILVAEVLYDASHREGHKKVTELWSSSGLQWSDFVPKHQVEQFLKDKKLEFTKGDDSDPVAPTTVRILVKISEHLVTLIVHQKANNKQVFDWIKSNVDESTTKLKKFIRALMTAVCSSAITGEGSCSKVDPREIKNRNDLLQKYLDHQAELELQALYALQALVTKLGHPPGVLRQMFDTLYDEDIISEDAFIQWEKSDDAQEQEGKGVAMKQVVQFFTWIKEAGDDADS